MLANPDIDYVARREGCVRSAQIAAQYQGDPEGFVRSARKWTVAYALRGGLQGVIMSVEAPHEDEGGSIGGGAEE